MVLPAFYFFHFCQSDDIMVFMCKQSPTSGNHESVYLWNRFYLHQQIFLFVFLYIFKIPHIREVSIMPSIVVRFLCALARRGTLPLFPVLAVVNNTAVKVGVQARPKLVFSSPWINTQNWNCWSMCNSMFSFRGTSILFSIAAALMYIPTSSAQRFLFFHTLTNTCYF